MNNLTIDMLLDKVKQYNQSEVEYVKSAYDLAFQLHKGQFRQSGEPYIIHPLNVAYTLACMYADRDTICAGLLHDVLEDSDFTKKGIETIFNKDVANLVDGVTKISRMNFSTKQAQNLANTRKIITSLENDVRIVIIKLADRLHNMRTLEYKRPEKQQENALETMELFAPLAYYIGAYQIKSELEDISFRYLCPEKYQKISDLRVINTSQNNEEITKMMVKIKRTMMKNGIIGDVNIRVKNVYGIYKQLKEGHDINNIHDLFSIKIKAKNISDCYQVLGLIHQLYKPVNNKFKDYICNPKTNMYQSLHTTLFCPNGNLVQTQIRTYEMDDIDTYGLCAYWRTYRGNARAIMQEKLTKECQFYESLVDLDSSFTDNEEFINQVRNNLLSKQIYVYDACGNIIELPLGSTINDIYFKIDVSCGNLPVVNGEKVSPSYILKPKDRVKFLKKGTSY